MVNQSHVLRVAALLCAASLLLTQSAVGQPPPPRALAPLLIAERDIIIPDRYIVVFNVGASPIFRSDAREGIALAERQSAAAQAIVRRLGGTIGFRYNAALIGFSATMSAAAVEEVRALPGVDHVETVRRVRADVGQSLVDPLWQKGLDRMDQRLISPLDHWYYYSETGNGVNVYVLDSGIRTTHNEFKDALNTSNPSVVRAFAPAAADFVLDGQGTNDCNGTGVGHGTSVASVIGGVKLGVAKRARLNSVRILNCAGDGNTEWATAGINYVKQNAALPALVNMSVSAEAFQQDPAERLKIDAEEIAVTNTINAGVTFVTSAGNALPNQTVGRDACLRTPARIAAAITVGSIDPTNDTRPQDTNFGSCIDLFAPGVDIFTASNQNDTQRWQTGQTGTSFAAPHVAGAAARYLEAHPTATPATVWGALHAAANRIDGAVTTSGWGGVGNRGTNSPNEMLHWGSLNDGYTDGEPHLTNVDGVRYDFQAAGEFVLLHDSNGLEIQTRQSPMATATPPPDPYSGLLSCVSMNTAVAARIGRHRMTFQPDPNGVPSPDGLQLRINGQVVAIAAGGLYLDGGRIAATPGGGIDVTFPDETQLLATPGFWNNAWFLNVAVKHTRATRGILGRIPPGGWLPALPDGSSLGPMPAGMPQRFSDLNNKFADAWRVANSTSLFDYAPGQSTATFTNRNWPSPDGQCNAGGAGPRRPIPLVVARRHCSGILDLARRDNCVFDVMATGDAVFARTYQMTERILTSSTRVELTRDKDWTRLGEPVTFTASVTQRGAGVYARRFSIGAVQFVVDNRPATEPIPVDRSGQASWTIGRLRPGVNKVVARFTPSPSSGLLPSSSLEVAHAVRRE